jgi:hypothetical protein
MMTAAAGRLTHRPERMRVLAGTSGRIAALVLLVSSIVSSMVCAPSAHAQSPSARVRVVRSDGSGVVVRIEGLRARLRAGSRGLVVGHNDPLHAASADSLTLPSLSFTVAVPFDATGFELTASDVRRELVALDRPIANPRAARIAGVGAIAVIRTNATVSVHYDPIHLDGPLLAVDTALTLSLRWRVTAPVKAERIGVVASESPGVERSLAALIVNYESAKQWRRANMPAIGLLRSGGWGIGEAVVLSVARDGVYHVSGAEIAEAGATTLAGTPLDRLALQHRGTPVPIRIADIDGDGTFGGGDVLEFVGERNRGVEGFYFDAVTDTNAYVLSWDARAGTTPRISPQSLGVDAQPLVSYDSTLHFERDSVAFLGFTMPRTAPWYGEVRTLHVPERVAGERFYWLNLTGNRVGGGRLPFDCSPILDDGATYRLRVRLANANQVAMPVEIALNDHAIVGAVTLPAVSDTLLEFLIPARALVNGANTLGIAIDLGSSDDFRVLVDYFELSGQWRPTASDVTARVRIPSGTIAGTPYRVRLDGLRTPVSVAVSDSIRVAVDSSAVPGVLFRMTSRLFYDGSQRINRGFQAQFGDTVVRSAEWALGVVVAEVDPAGRLVRSEFFRTYDVAGEADRAAQYITATAQGNFIVAGTTAGFGPNPLPQSLRSALDAIGSRVASQNGYEFGAWTFVARMGDRSSAREAFAPLSGPESNGVTMSEWFASPEGTSYRGVFTIAGQPGAEFTVGAPMAAAKRYHRSDELVDAANRADLIIVTHKAFREQAERLAAHRRTHGPYDDHDFAVRVVDVETVYDEFGSGIKNQSAIRAFLQYADTNWSDPKPWYVLLFGDASFDPQMRLGGSKMVDYVPTFGEPASDYWYTMPHGGVNPDVAELWPYDTAASFRQVIGRLPAMSPREARTMVDKIIEYDTAAPAAWNKRVVFLAGGSDEGEVDANRYEAASIARDYITSGTFLGDTTIVYRRDFPGFPSTPPHPDSRWAQQEMARGGLWVNSAGHGSRTVLDLDFGTPDEIDNQNRYYLLATFSCETGAFSDHELSLRNEDFVKAPGRGAIAAFGSTSWSYSHLNAETEQNLFALLTSDTAYVSNLGALTTWAKWRVFADYGVFWMVNPPEGFIRRDHLLSYSLLGDPSQDLKVSRHHELAFESPAISDGAGGEVSVSDSAAIVDVDVANYGRPILASDGDVDSTITIVGTIIGADRVERRDTFIVRWLARSQHVRLELPIDGEPGEYTVRIEADPEGQVDEGYRADNVLVLPLLVRGNQPLPLEPVPFGRVPGYDAITIRLLNPPSGGGATITVDTVETFDSPAAFTSATIGAMTSDDLTTTWTFAMPPALRGATRFWWRAVATSGDPEIAARFPLDETFTVEPEARAEAIFGGRRQMALARIENLLNTDAGVGPGSRRARLSVRAIGQSRYLSGQDILASKIGITVDDGSGSTISLADDNLFGIHIAVLDPETLELVDGMYRQFFLFERPQIADSLAAFVATIPSGYPVIVATMGRSFDNVRESAPLRAALASLGAQLVVDSVGPDDSYALIGGKGLPASQVWVFGDSLRRAKESPTGYAEVRVDAEYQIRPGPGTLATPTIGPATAWRSARLITAGAGATPSVSVIGVRRDGVRDSLATFAAASTVDLGFVDVVRYPRLELRIAFAGDSTTRLRALEVAYDPSPELAIVPRTIATDHDSVLQGDPASLAVTVVNLSRVRTADSVDVSLRHRSSGDLREIAATGVTLAPLERRTIRFDLVSDRFGATNQFIVALNPDDRPAEPYRHNNADTTTMRASVDTTRPKLVVYADGQRLLDGDYVGPTARFEIRLLDNSHLSISDSNAITLFLDLAEITLDSGAVFSSAAAGESRAALTDTPPAPGLADGEHTLTYMARDASGNRTESEFVRFYVERGLRLANVVNYPNPFRERTEFTFAVAGGSQPTGGEIAIYTVAGRRIKSIALGAADVHIGFNHVEWDGLDDDRDPLANGVYLYRVTVESADGRQEVIEKLVVMR